MARRLRWGGGPRRVGIFCPYGMGCSIPPRTRTLPPRKLVGIRWSVIGQSRPHVRLLSRSRYMTRRLGGGIVTVRSMALVRVDTSALAPRLHSASLAGWWLHQPTGDDLLRIIRVRAVPHVRTEAQTGVVLDKEVRVYWSAFRLYERTSHGLFGRCNTAPMAVRIPARNHASSSTPHAYGFSKDLLQGHAPPAGWWHFGGGRALGRLVRVGAWCCVSTPPAKWIRTMATTVS